MTTTQFYKIYLRMRYALRNLPWPTARKILLHLALLRHLAGLP